MNKFRLFGFEFDSREVTIFIVIGILLILGPKIFTLVLGYNDFIEIGEIGDTFGGLTSPFLSYFGSILVFLALKAQIDANNKIAQQFEEQNTDQLFFRVFENFKELRNKATYTTMKTPGDDKKKGSEAFKWLGMDFKYYLDNIYLLEYSFYIIENHFEMLDKRLISSIANGVDPLIYGTSFDSEEFIEKLNNIPGNEKGNYILTQYSSYRNVKKNPFSTVKEIRGVYIENSFFESLIKIGQVYFYDFDFNMRTKVYELAILWYKKAQKESLDGFLNAFEHLFLIIRNSKNKKIYSEYLYYNIGESEKFILFLMLNFEGLNEDFKKDLKVFFHQFDITFSNKYFFNNPKEEIVKSEVNNLLNL